MASLVLAAPLLFFAGDVLLIQVGIQRKLSGTSEIRMEAAKCEKKPPNIARNFAGLAGNLRYLITWQVFWTQDDPFLSSHEALLFFVDLRNK